MSVSSVLFTDKDRNNCPQFVSICFGLGAVVPQRALYVWAVVLEDKTMTQVQFCCWLLELCFIIFTYPSSWFLPSLTRFPVPDTLKQPCSMMCLTAGMVSLSCVNISSIFVTRELQFHLIWSKSIFAACTIFLRVLLRLLQSGFFLVCSPLLISHFQAWLSLESWQSWERLLPVSFPESLEWFTSSSTVFYLCAVWFSLNFSIILLMPVLKPCDNFV